MSGSCCNLHKATHFLISSTTSMPSSSTSVNIATLQVLPKKQNKNHFCSLALSLICMHTCTHTHILAITNTQSTIHTHTHTRTHRRNKAKYSSKHQIKKYYWWSFTTVFTSFTQKAKQKSLLFPLSLSHMHAHMHTHTYTCNHKHTIHTHTEGIRQSIQVNIK